MTDFHLSDLPDGHFWEAYDLSKVDLSNNQISEIPENLASQSVSFHVWFLRVYTAADATKFEFQLKFALTSSCIAFYAAGPQAARRVL